jgi:hypothetical protein
MSEADDTSNVATAAVHRVIFALLAEYDEALLSEGARAEVELHVRTCRDCACELQIVRAARDRLRRMEEPTIAPDVRMRIAAAVAAVPAPRSTEVMARSSRSVRAVPGATLAAWGGWLAAAGLLLVLVIERGAPAPGARGGTANPAVASTGPAIPMVRGMVADYTVRMVRHLPGGENNLAAVLDSVPFAVRPISATGTQVIGAWTTAIRGQPMARPRRRPVRRVRLALLPSSRRARGGGGPRALPRQRRRARRPRLARLGERIGAGRVAGARRACPTSHVTGGPMMTSVE